MSSQMMNSLVYTKIEKKASKNTLIRMKNANALAFLLGILLILHFFSILVSLEKMFFVSPATQLDQCGGDKAAIWQALHDFRIHRNQRAHADRHFDAFKRLDMTKIGNCGG